MNTTSGGTHSGRPDPHGGHPEEALLHDLLDGELTPDDAERARGHLAECEECRVLFRDLEALQARARALPESLPPERDLWGTVEARIRTGGQGATESVEGPAAAHRISPRRGPREHRIGRPRGWPTAMGSAAGLAAAAGIAAVVAGTLLFTGDGNRPGGDGPATAGQVDAGTSARFASEVDEVEQAYRPALDELQALAAARELSPGTREVLEDNLAVIERAIAESREAVLADPEGHRALENLRRMYDAKVEVLRSVAVRY